jgi:hypothetical protein
VSSKRHVRRKTCVNKEWYATAEYAEQALIHIQRLFSHRGEQNIYECVLCGHWHIGHIPTEQRRTRREQFP